MDILLASSVLAMCVIGQNSINAKFQALLMRIWKNKLALATSAESSLSALDNLVTLHLARGDMCEAERYSVSLIQFAESIPVSPHPSIRHVSNERRSDTGPLLLSQNIDGLKIQLKASCS